MARSRGTDPQTESHHDIVAIGAHPDDVEIGCGGTLARFVREGYRVGAIDLTQGEMGTRGSKATRAREALAASKVLGLATRVNLGLADAHVSGHDEKALKELVAVLRRLRPKVLLLPYGTTRHPDHGEASRLGEKAAFLAGLERYAARTGRPHRPGLVMYWMERWAFTPSLVVDVSADFATKMKAIHAYASQFALGRHQGKGPETFISRPGFLESIAARASYFGAQSGVAYGEPFLLRSLLPVGPATLLAAAEVPA